MTSREDALALLHGYENTKSQIFKDLGNESGIATLHVAFYGNAAAAAAFVGLNESSVRNRFTQAGLPCNGNQIRKPDARIHTVETNGMQAAWGVHDWIDYLRRRTSVQEKAVECIWKLPKNTEYGKLHFIGDVHFGNPDQDFCKFEEFIGWLKSQENDRFIILGDLFEMRSKLSPGGEPIMPQAVAYEVACEVFRPVMSQCLVVHTGNHDQRVQIQTDMPYDPTRDFAAEFNVPWAGKDGFHRINISSGNNSQKYVGYCHHGTGASRSKGGRANQLQQALRSTTADYVALAHLHDKDSVTDVRFGPDEEGIVKQFHLSAVRCGSWLKNGPGSYGREALFSPGVPGAATLHLYTTKHDAHARV